MRITNSILVRDMMWNVGSNLNKMAHYNNQLTTGKRVFRPSEDPVGVTQILKYKTDISALAQYQKNIEDAQGQMDVVESSLMNVKEVLQRIRELTVAASNASSSKEDVDKIRVEIDELTKELISTGNATNAGRYVFSGLETDKKLFNEDGTYHIDITTERAEKRAVVQHEIAVGELLRTGTHGLDVFGMMHNKNPLADLMPRAAGEVGAATNAFIRVRIDPTADFSGSGQVLDIQVDSSTYDVDESLLSVHYNRPMTKERLISALSQASNGMRTLSEVADIYFDKDDSLVIRSKLAGSAHTVSGAALNSPAITGVATTAGTNASSVTIGAGAPVTDAAIAAATGKHGLLVNDGVKAARIEIDFDAITTAADFGTALQTAIDTQFPPAGRITVNAAAGAPLTMTISSGSFSYDAIVAAESRMIRDLRNLSEAMTPGTYDIDRIGEHIDIVTGHIDRVMAAAGEIGGKTNRLSFIKDRNDSNTLTFSSLLSGVQDVDYSQAIMLFKNLENVYRASLSVGSKVIQPSLVDFIR